MKKRLQKTKFLLNKETIVNLTRVDMREFRGGADGSDIGNSCYTGKCCRSKKECYIVAIPTEFKC